MASKPPLKRASVKAAIDYAGSVTALGRLLKISSQAISQWKEVPIDRAIELERISKGRITRQQIRPDIFCGGAA